MKKFYILFLIVISFLILPSLTNAQSYTWNGSQSSKWFNPLNWTPSTGVPNSSSDSVTIDINLPNEPVIDSGNVVLKYLKINQSSVILTVSNNASLSIVGVPGLITGFIKGSGTATIIFTDTLKVPASFTINLYDSSSLLSDKATLLSGGTLRPVERRAAGALPRRRAAALGRADRAAREDRSRCGVLFLDGAIRRRPEAADAGRFCRRRFGQVGALRQQPPLAAVVVVPPRRRTPAGLRKGRGAAFPAVVLRHRKRVGAVPIAGAGVCQHLRGDVQWCRRRVLRPGSGARLTLRGQ